MQEVFEKLRELQVVLAKKYDVLEEVKKIPRTLITKEELLSRGKEIYHEKHERLEKTYEELKALRISLDEAEQARENYEKQMELISTQREFEALEKEIKDASAHEQSLRKSLLAKEKYYGELQEQLNEHEQLMEIQEEEVATERAKQDSLLAEKEKEIALLTEKEQALIPGIDESILFKFERIIKSKRGIGIVPIHGLICQGCHMMLPVQFVNTVRKGEDFSFCPYCSRILYWEEAEGVDEISSSVEPEFEIEEESLSEFVDVDEFEDVL